MIKVTQYIKLPFFFVFKKSLDARLIELLLLINFLFFRISFSFFTVIFSFLVIILRARTFLVHSISLLTFVTFSFLIAFAASIRLYLLFLTYLGCTWDFRSRGVVKIGQAGMIQDLVASRERTHKERNSLLKGNPHSPAAPFIYDHSPDSPLLCEDHARIFHRDVATALYLGNRTRPDIVLTLGELCKRVKAPTEEDDRKLDRLIAYLRSTRDRPLTLGCSTHPTVTVSVDAAYCNRDEKRSTTGMCITLGTGIFATASKVQKTATKSSTEAEIVAVSDGMNIPLWLSDIMSLMMIVFDLYIVLTVLYDGMLSYSQLYGYIGI